MIENSGIMSFGVNNHDGRLAWSEVYYLKAMIDMLKNWPLKEDGFYTKSLREQVKKSLDLDIFIVNQLLKTKFYSKLVGTRLSQHRV